MTTKHPATDTTAAPAKHPPTTTVAPAAEAPTDLRPAWERVAYAWLVREVDANQPVDAARLAGEVSVNPWLASELVRVLRAQRQRDPELAELRSRLVRDQIIDAYLAHEVNGDQPLEATQLADQVGTTAAIARQWLHALRAQRASEAGLGSMLGEQVSHGQPTPEQLAQLQAYFAAGGHQQAIVTARPPDAERVAVEVERRYWTREVRARQPVGEAGLARELGVDRRQVAAQLAELRAGPATARGRLEQLWAEQSHDPDRPPRSSQLAYRLGRDPQLRAARGHQPARRAGRRPAGGACRRRAGQARPTAHHPRTCRAEWGLAAAGGLPPGRSGAVLPHRAQRRLHPPSRPRPGTLRRLPGPPALPGHCLARPPGA